MPIRDPEKRREANREAMRRRRAAGLSVEDPLLAAQRKRRWYEPRRAEIVAKNRERRQAEKEQALINFTRTLKP